MRKNVRRTARILVPLALFAAAVTGAAEPTAGGAETPDPRSQAMLDRMEQARQARQALNETLESITIDLPSGRLSTRSG